MSTDRGQTERFLQDLFGVDLVLPEQFYPGLDTLSPLSGERALMWAVFTDGIERYRRTAHSRAKRDIEEFREVEAWLLATDWDSIFSFVNLCEAFGFAPEPVRKVLVDWKAGGTERGRRQRFRPITLRAA